MLDERSVEEETEAEMIKNVLEVEVGGTGLLAQFLPLIVRVISNPSQFSSSSLQTSAILALAKFMMIRWFVEG